MNSGTVETISITREALAEHICRRMDEELERISQQWRSSATISYFVVDDVLPKEWAHRVAAAFPQSGSMMLRRSLRELKYVSAQMNSHDPLLEEALFAFQAPSVVERVGKVTGLRSLEPDELLYAGGISVMGQTHFLNPHIDNSHDKSRERYRVLNLLYYASPEWKLDNGGNLELWPDGPGGKPMTITSTFNRLVVMVTHQRSWHSVSPITAPANRCCISNYYFSRFPVGDAEYFHVTSFRGRPEQRLRDLALRADGLMRGWVRKLFPQGVRETRHYYKGKDR
jgi:Rps23 Pro-64 3,4-dihydroxylase Tpa1-like proline 4-hydroxylase